MEKPGVYGKDKSHGLSFSLVQAVRPPSSAWEIHQGWAFPLSCFPCSPFTHQVPQRRLVMSTAQGLFPSSTGYWALPKTSLLFAKPVRAQKEQGRARKAKSRAVNRECSMKYMTITITKPIPTLAQGSPCFLKPIWKPWHSQDVLAWFCQQGSNVAAR